MFFLELSGPRKLKDPADHQDKLGPNTKPDEAPKSRHGTVPGNRGLVWFRVRSNRVLIFYRVLEFPGPGYLNRFDRLSLSRQPYSITLALIYSITHSRNVSNFRRCAELYPLWRHRPMHAANGNPSKWSCLAARTAVTYEHTWMVHTTYHDLTQSKPTCQN